MCHLPVAIRIPKVKFLVMLRDPVDWLASRICRLECSDEHKFLDLCDAHGNAQSPLLHWFVYCSEGVVEDVARWQDQIYFYSGRLKITTSQRRIVDSFWPQGRAEYRIDENFSQKYNL